MSKFKFLVASLFGIAAIAASSAAEAHVNFDIGIGVPAYVAPPPAPVYYEPAPVYVAPRPVVVAPAPGYYDDWQARAWQERQWRREQRWREHEWRERRHEWRRWHEDND